MSNSTTPARVDPGAQAPVTIRVVDDRDVDTVLALMAQYLTEAWVQIKQTYGVQMPGTPKHAPAFLDQFRAPHGDLLVAELGDAVIGVGASRSDGSADVDEIKSMYGSRGFRLREPYEGSEIPAELRDLWLFYELRLAKTA